MSEIKRRQRTHFFMGLAVAALPLIAQAIALMAVNYTPLKRFEGVVASVSAAWIASWIFFGIGIAGTSLIGAHWVKGGAGTGVAYVGLWICTIALGIMYGLTIIFGGDGDWQWYVFVGVVILLTSALSYILDMATAAASSF